MKMRFLKSILLLLFVISAQAQSSADQKALVKAAIEFKKFQAHLEYNREVIDLQPEYIYLEYQNAKTFYLLRYRDTVWTQSASARKVAPYYRFTDFYQEGKKVTLLFEYHPLWKNCHKDEQGFKAMRVPDEPFYIRLFLKKKRKGWKIIKSKVTEPVLDPKEASWECLRRLYKPFRD